MLQTVLGIYTARQVSGLHSTKQPVAPYSIHASDIMSQADAATYVAAKTSAATHCAFTMTTNYYLQINNFAE